MVVCLGGFVSLIVYLFSYLNKDFATNNLQSPKDLSLFNENFLDRSKMRQWTSI